MRRGITTAARAGLIGLALLMAGCGWFRGDDEHIIDSLPELSWEPVARGAAVYAAFDIYDVTPDRGFVFGMEPVSLGGLFPQMIATANAAYQVYGVYFGMRRAFFDGSFSPVISPTEMHVLSPTPEDVGLVDVRVEAPLFGLMSQLDQAYRYYSMYIGAVIPPFGPLAGGNSVRVEGLFLTDAIIDLAAAEAIYTVLIGGIVATFDDSVVPIITAASLDVANKTYTSNALNVIAPPGAAPGRVDVEVRSVLGREPPVVLPEGYQYLGPLELSEVDPDRGFILGREPVTLRGSFPVLMDLANMMAADAAYGVYFGELRLDRRAAFDDSFVPAIITPTEVHVLSPPGEDVGLVDVHIQAIVDPEISSAALSTLVQAYRYYSMYVGAVIPPAGPLAGGNPLRVEGLFLTDAITDVAAADAIYRVLIDGVMAAFDATADPIITAGSIDIANNTYTPNAMHVIAPPGAIPGLVDVEVISVLDREPPAILPEGYEYVPDIQLTAVNPDNGFILGDPVSPLFSFDFTPVTLTGTFPVSADITSLALAKEHYTVYFGPRRVDRIALFNDDPLFPAIITADEMHVRVPVGEDIGPVDVRVEVNRLPIIFAELERAYRYYSMYIGAIIPNAGPQAGGNPVEIQGLFLTDAIDDLTIAEQIYTVFFDVNQAMFDITRPPDPVITAASIDLANRIYVANSLYVAAPPADMPGFVDVIVLNDLGREPRAISDPLKYEYTDDLGIGQWIDATVQPNPVGKLPSGHLLVTIVVSGTISDDTTEIFIVPQGGNPANPSHRIELETISIESDVDNNLVWIGTNANLIDTVTGPEAILTDGHAAIFVHELETDTIVGGPIDDGTIDPAAEEGRHFIIDTIPPRMLEGAFVPDSLIGGDFFDPGGINSDVFRTVIADIPPSPLHPFPLPSTGIITTQDIPWDQSRIRRNQVDVNNDGFDDFTGETLFDPSTNRAQIFYNTGSIANDFAIDDLRFNLFVTFEDVDVYTTLGLVADPITDVDAFNPGITARQVAGFGFEVFPITPPTGDREDGVLGDRRDGVLNEGDNVLVQWDTASGASAPPNVLNITTTYEASEPDVIDAGDISPNLAAAFTLLEATWEANGGIEWTGQNLLMPIVFRGVDRAGNYFPRGDTELDKRKLWTLSGQWTVDFATSSVTFDQNAGPLNLWWLVNTGTEFTHADIPANENTRNPNFSWQNTSPPPDPDTIPFPEPDDGPDRLFNYRLWNTDGDKSREEARNGPYTALGDWNGWSAKDFLTTSEIQPDIVVSEGAWMLLVVIAADEAGNVEQWPLSDLGDIFLGDPPITVASNAGSKGNWRRWYVAPAEEVVETEVRPTFWHDKDNQPTIKVIDLGENVLGNIEIVPLPARSSNEVVSVEFRVDVVPDPSMTPESVEVSYILFEEGQVFGSGAVLAASGQSTVFISFDDLGNRSTRQPVHYVFQATGQVNIGTDTVTDSTPANFKFVVVDNVAKFIEGRGDDQPIKEQDRP